MEFFVESRLKFQIHVLRGGCVNSRISSYPDSNYFGLPPEGSIPSRLALFAAYHVNDTLPISNLNYLKALLACGFRTIYLHNGPLSQEALDSLRPYCEQIICRINIGQDFGAWKDGYLYCESRHLLNGIEWLLICNDSNLFLGGEHAQFFIDAFTKNLESSNIDLIALNKNFEFRQHFQSYFLCFNRRLFSGDSFKKFWHEYVPLNSRYHSIKRGELALTKEVVKNSKTRIIYSSPNLYQAMVKHVLTHDEILEYFPKNAINNLEAPPGNISSPISNTYVHQILAYLDSHNPSHAYALLYVKFLKSPFLKKDLVCQDVYTLAQISSLLESQGIQVNSLFYDELINTYLTRGTHLSYLGCPRQAYKCGVPWHSSTSFHGYGYKVMSLRS